MTQTEHSSVPHTIIRGTFGGALMGLANLVPGISGGTMLLAAGIYPRFVEAIADVTRLRFRKMPLIVLASVVGAAALAILLLAGTVKDLVVHNRWVMYSVFIGLTLGGVPIVWRMIGSGSRATWIGAAAGFAAMAVLAFVQTSGAGAGADAEGPTFMLLAGIAGASAMILPGVSGGYLLLVLGVYVPILAGIDACRRALSERSLEMLIDPVLQVVLPVGIGVVIGVVVVSNVLRWLLEHHRQATLGALLGLLLGAVAGLWPFQQGMAPSPGDRLKGQTVILAADGTLRLAESGRAVEPEDFPTGYFSPTAAQAGGAAGLVLAGFVLTLGIGRLSRDDDEEE